MPALPIQEALMSDSLLLMEPTTLNVDQNLQNHVIGFIKLIFKPEI